MGRTLPRVLCSGQACPLLLVYLNGSDQAQLTLGVTLRDGLEPAGHTTQHHGLPQGSVRAGACCMPARMPIFLPAEQPRGLGGPRPLAPTSCLRLAGKTGEAAWLIAIRKKMPCPDRPLLPEALKTPSRHTRVMHVMTRVAVAKVVLHGPQIRALVGQVVAAAMPQGAGGRP
jgi:hypothetical protein